MVDLYIEVYYTKYKGIGNERIFQRSDAYDNRRNERKEAGTWVHV